MNLKESQEFAFYHLTENISPKLLLDFTCALDYPRPLRRFGNEMPRYHYDTLRIACLHPVDFAPEDLRAAVEYLKTIKQAKFTGLMAETSTTAGHYKLLARVLLGLDDIIGKTPAEVWEMFDAAVDDQRQGLLNRDGSP